MVMRNCVFFTSGNKKRKKRNYFKIKVSLMLPNTKVVIPTECYGKDQYIVSLSISCFFK